MDSNMLYSNVYFKILEGILNSRIFFKLSCKTILAQRIRLLDFIYRRLCKKFGLNDWVFKGILVFVVKNYIKTKLIFLFLKNNLSTQNQQFKQAQARC